MADVLTTPRLVRRAHQQRYFVASRLEGAAETIGRLRAGDEVTGLTAGQFSMIDVLEHMVREAGGDADVFVSTWSAGLYDIEQVASLRSDGLVRRARWMVDRAVFSRSPAYAGAMMECFGRDAFRDSNIHAKVAIVEGRDLRMVCRGSMNLNKNLRAEQFDISVSDEIVDFFRTWADALWEAAAPDTSTESVFAKVWADFTALRGAAPRHIWPSAREMAAALPNVRGVG